jgi:outer membrane protein assembly factor BamB
MARTSKPVLPLGLALALGAAALLLPASPAGGQAPKKGPADPEDRDRPIFSHLITLPTSESLEEKLAGATVYLKGEDSKRATVLLQWILDQPEDAFVPVRRKDPEGKRVFGWVSARQEANRLLGTLPEKGLDAYTREVEPKANDLLKAALASGDLLAIAHVADHYRHTPSGRRAIEMIGSHYLDNGHYPTAARFFRRLLDRPSAAPVTEMTLIRATLAFRRAGDETNAARAWKLLKERAGREVAIGGKFISLTVLDKKLSAVRSGGWGSSAAPSWQVFRGAPGRTATAVGKATRLASGWRQPTVESRFVSDWLDEAQDKLKTRGESILPAAVPLAVGGKIIYRSHRGIEVLDRATGRVAWASMPLRGSLEELAEDAPTRAHVDFWVRTLQQSFPYTLIENGTVGALSADERQVYAVEDLALPVVPINWPNFYLKQGEGLEFDHADELTEAVYQSRLVAFDLQSGKALWTAGRKDDKQAGALKGVHFLGAPLPLGGKLYAVVEKEQALTLACLDAANGRLLWFQTLATPKRNLLLDGARRTWGAHPAHSEGVLVCPTNAGAVVAVDLASRGLLWAHSYRDEPPQPMPVMGKGKFRPWNMPQPAPRFGLESKWKFAAPIIAQGKVLLAAPDGSTLDCLDLWTGALLWRTERADEDLYVAGVFKDQVVVVGKSYVGAFQLQTGSVLWSVLTPEPSGLGVAAGDIYYLPVRAAPETGRPAILAIQLDNKGALGSSLAMPGGDIPGNLLLSQGSLVSQTVTQLAVYPCDGPAPANRK